MWPVTSKVVVVETSLGDSVSETVSEVVSLKDSLLVTSLDMVDDSDADLEVESERDSLR